MIFVKFSKIRAHNTHLFLFFSFFPVFLVKAWIQGKKHDLRFTNDELGQEF